MPGNNSSPDVSRVTRLARISSRTVRPRRGESAQGLLRSSPKVRGSMLCDFTKLPRLEGPGTVPGFLIAERDGGRAPGQARQIRDRAQPARAGPQCGLTNAVNDLPSHAVCPTTAAACALRPSGHPTPEGATHDEDPLPGRG